MSDNVLSTLANLALIVMTFAAAVGGESAKLEQAYRAAIGIAIGCGAIRCGIAIVRYFMERSAEGMMHRTATHTRVGFSDDGPASSPRAQDLARRVAEAEAETIPVVESEGDSDGEAKPAAAVPKPASKQQRKAKGGKFYPSADDFEL